MDVKLGSTNDRSLFPKLQTSPARTEPGHAAVPIRLPSPSTSLVSFAQKYGLENSCLLHICWATILKAYTGSETPHFLCIDGAASWRVRRIDFTKKQNVVNSLQTLTHLEASEVNDVERLHHLNTAVLWNAPTQCQWTVPLSIHAQDAGTQWRAHLEYRTSMLAEEHAIQLADLVGQILAELVRDASFESFDMCSRQTVAQVSHWNANLPNPSQSCVQDHVIPHCRDSPNSLAVCAWDGDITYGELDHLSSLLSKSLVDMGGGPGAFVGIFLDKTRWTLVVILAILKAGGAFYFMDVAFPLERLRQMTTALKSDFIVTSTAFADQAATIATRTLVVDEKQMLSLKSQSIPSGDSPLPTSPDNPVYAAFTSGSTGAPKAAVISHYSFCSANLHVLKAMGYRPGGRVLQLSASGFDVCIQDHLNSMISGSCLCIPPRPTHNSNFHETITQMRVNFAIITPTVARLLHPAELPDLEVLGFGGEPFTNRDIATWTPHVRLFNVFGPAECSVVSSVQSYEHGLTETNVIGPSKTALYWIVDPGDRDKLMPIGAIGELLIEGPIVGKGYAGDLAQTNERFIKAPKWRAQFAGDCGTRIYCTGDLVQYLDGGAMRYIGRADLQAKLRGQRLELSEVECHMRDELPPGTDVIAEIITPKEDTSPVLVGFLRSPDMSSLKSGSAGDRSSGIFTAPSQGSRAEAARLVAHLTACLPSYMVPSYVLPLHTIPNTNSGKISRKELQHLASQLSRRELDSFMHEPAERRLPETPAEKTICQSVEKVLQIRDFGMNDNFFGLGGDSLRIMQLARQVKDAGFFITTETVLRASTLSDLAHAMTFIRGAESDISQFRLLPNDLPREQATRAAMDTCNIVSLEDIDDIYPCTPLQEGLMALSVHQNKPTYVMHSIHELPSEIDVGKLQQAWNKVVSLNPILRTYIVQVSTGMLQVVARDSSTSIWEVTENLEELHSRCDQWSIEFGKPLMRLLLCRSELRNTLGISIHHSLYDGWSWPQILRQVEAAYYERAEVESVPFQPFIEYIQCSTSKDQAIHFWREYLSEYSAPVFPTSAGQSKDLPPRFESLKQSMSLPSSHGAQTLLSTVIELAWGMTVSQYTGSNDVCFGSTLAGRSAPLLNIDQILGPTISTIPRRIKLDGLQTIEAASILLQNQSADMIPFQSTGLQRIASCGPEAAAACRFQNHLVIQPAIDNEELTIFASGDTVEYADDYAISIEVTLPAFNSTAVDVKATYDSCVVKEWLMRQVLQQFEHNLKNTMQHPHKKLNELSLISTAGLDLLSRWNREVPQAVERTVHDLVVQNCREQPNQIAVDAWDGILTYAELENQSSMLAARLQTLDVQGGKYVMVIMDRSMRAVVVMQAVAKTGGALVLIDPSTPPFRLQQIRDATDASLVISSETYTSIAKNLGAPWMSAEGIDGERLLFTEPRVSLEDPFYVVFTSGSSGTPKGIVIQHRAFATAATINGPMSLMSKTSRVLHVASFAFDASIAEVYYPLVLGGCVCIPSAEGSRSNLENAMNHFRVDWATLTPSMARALDPSRMTSLRALALAGEACTKTDIEAWGKHVYLMNVYGPSEATVDATMQLDVSLKNEASNIGWGAATVCWIVDPEDHNRLMPLGARGELALEGPVLAQGYLKNRSLTEAVFIKDPEWLHRVRQSKPTRIYLTGDLAEYSSRGDGSIVYLGRKDNQIKLRGQRIELGEIEQNLRECLPSAREVVVEIVKSSDPGAQPMLVAFILLDEQLAAPQSHEFVTSLTPLGQEQLRSAETLLHERMPHAMIPTAFLPLKKVPSTTTGKIDRRLLRETASAWSRRDLARYSAHQASQKQLPRTPSEVALHAAVSAALQMPLDEVGMNDHFFHLGGDSISSMKVAALLAEHGCSLAVADFFRHPLLEDLADVIGADGEKGNAPEDTPPFSILDDQDPAETIHRAARLCAVPSHEIEDIYPCTPMQEALFALTLKQQGQYVMEMTCPLPISVDLTRVKAAWQSVCEANPILRTRIISSAAGEGCSLQVVLRKANLWSSNREPLYVSDGGALLKTSLSQADGVWTLHIWLHHALYDGHSLQIILEQAEAAYHRQSPPLCPFNTFSACVKKLDRAESGNFWKREFADLETNMFPPGRSLAASPRPEVVSHAMKIGDISSTGFTMATIIHAACAITLGHYTLSDEVVYGLTLSGRDFPMRGIENVVGPTITGVPLRVRIPQSATLADVLKNIQDHLGQIAPHDQMGLHDIGLASPESAAACRFRTHVVIQPVESNTSNTIFREPVVNDEEFSRFATSPLVLTFAPSADKLSARLSATFDLSCLDATEVTRMALQIEHVVQQIAQNITTAVKDVQVASPRDLAQMTEHNACLPPREDKLVHDLILDRCLLQPHIEAVCSWDGSLTYGELHDASSRLAQLFVSLGVGSSPVNVVCMEKSRWTVVTMVSILKAGSACAFLDVSQPAARMAQVVKQTGAAFVISSPATHGAAKAAAFENATVVTVAPDFIYGTPEPSSATTPAIAVTDPAFVIFTSGSSGRPKGIVLEHASLATGLRDQRERSRVHDDSRVLHFASLAFDGGIYEILTALIFGSCLCIPSEYDRLSNLTGFISEKRVSWAFMIPSATEVLDPLTTPTLKSMVMGGEPLTSRVVKRWAVRKDLCVVNLYGPAEATFCCAGAPVDPREWTPGLIGPFFNGVGWIVNPSDTAQLCAWGAVGELLIEGPNIAREYINDPEKTAASFIPSPPWLSAIRGHSSSRLYRSGDLVQYTSNGHVRYVSRKDRQVKLNGQRIEVEEIESTLSQFLPSQASVIVDCIVPQSEHARPQLFAFIQLGNPTVMEQLEDHTVFAKPDRSFLEACRNAEQKLTERLPRYMIPTIFLRLREVPTTENGKINRRYLSQMAGSLQEQDLMALSNSEIVRSAPANEVEVVLAGLWANVLGRPVDTISSGDNFFHSGGDSILAMRLVAAFRQRGYWSTVAGLFENPRLSDMAAIAEPIGDAISTKAAAIPPFTLAPKSDKLLHTAETLCSVPRQDIEDIYPCTPLQEALFALSMRDKGAFFSSHRFKLRADVDISRLKHAWQLVVQANPILRTRIVQDSALLQVVINEQVPWRVVPNAVNLEGYTSALLENPVQFGQRLIELVINQPIPRQSPTELVMVMHHTIYDAGSLPLLFEQLEQAYYHQQSLEFRPCNGFIDYITNSSRQSSARDYWQKRLSDASVAVFPALPSDAYTPFTNSSVQHTLPWAQQSSRATTSATILELAWALTVSQSCDTNDVVFGMVLSGRDADLAGIETMTAPTIATVPVRVQIGKDHIVAEKLKQLQHDMSGLSAFQHLGLQNIRRLSRDADAACQFQNLLLIQPANDSAPSALDGDADLMTPVQEYDNAGAFSTYALEVTCEIATQELRIRFDFDSNALDDKSAERMLAQFIHNIEQIYQPQDSADSVTTMADLDPIASPSLAEIQQWNTLLPPAINRCIHEGIAEQICRSPNAEAVCAWDGNWTYRHLDELSNKLAADLQARGVGPEVLVPILAEKTKWVAIAVLGVVRAGGTIVLLDPDIPLQRLRSICASDGPRVILSTRSSAHVARQLTEAEAVVVIEEKLFSQPDRHTLQAVAVSPSNALYVIYTSGSSGQPKGIVITHSAFYTSGLAQLAPLYLDAGTRTLQFSSHMFDVSVADYLWTFLAGGCVCVASQEMLRNDLVGTINEMRVNRADLTPSIAREIRPEDVPTIQTILLGGEAMSQSDIAQWAGRVRLVNGYGPSECSVCCTLADVHTHSDPATIGHTYGELVESCQAHRVSLEISLGYAKSSPASFETCANSSASIQAQWRGS